jgi:hypothetical protein
MTLNSNPFSCNGPSQDRRRRIARQKVLQVITGEDAETQGLGGAIQELVYLAPEDIERMCNALMTLPPAPCDPFVESLEECAERGETAPDQVPHLSAHLQACAACQAVLEALRSARAEEPAWAALARRLDARDSA